MTESERITESLIRNGNAQLPIALNRNEMSDCAAVERARSRLRYAAKKANVKIKTTASDYNVYAEVIRG